MHSRDTGTLFAGEVAMNRDERRGRRRWLPPLVVLAGLLLIPLLYRSTFVYEWRPGRCAMSHEPPVMISGDTSRAATPRGWIRVVSWNIGGHSALLDGNYIRRIAESIRSFDSDVVALQEVHRGTWQARFGDQLQELAAHTGMTAVYSPSFRTHDGDYGNVILTRGHVLHASRLDLAGIGEPRAVVTARIRIAGETIDMAATHLSAWGPLNSRWRRSQAECIARSFSGDPRIIAGDLNTNPSSSDLQPLFAAGWVESDSAGTPTHKALGTKLDYILLPPGFTPRSVTVPEVGESDHRPVVADLVRTVV